MMEKVFPTLTDGQIQRIAPHGGVHRFRRGEVLVEAGAIAPGFFVVTAGRSRSCDRRETPSG
jgi:CRP-like cAMP-binding protein